MYRTFITLLTLSFGFLLLLNFISCSSSIPNVALNKSYKFSEKQTITTYVIPTENAELDETYSRVLYLDLQARGYKVIDANRLLEEHSENFSVNNQRLIADSLMSIKYIPVSDVYVVAKPSWGSEYVLTYFSESRSAYWRYYKFAGMYVPTLTSQVTFFDRLNKAPIKSYSVTDTMYLLSENENAELIYHEHPWMVVAKQLSRELTDIPICSIANSSSASIKFPIDLWVDNSYRDAFPNTWKDRLRLRVLYASDLLRSQFNVELVISEFIEWNSIFTINLENSIKKLYASTMSNANALQIGITFNKDLKRNWTDKNDLGFAYLLSNDAVITAQPSFPSVGQNWNSIEESITLAHEIGHILGAIHVPDQNSIMYPYASSLTFEFDPVNKKIIDATKTNFLMKNQKERLISYSDEMVVIKDFPAPNSNPILSPISNVISQINGVSRIITEDSVKVFYNLTSLLPDSVITIAVMGYLEFKNNNYEKAKKSFQQVLNINPDFAEVQYYLSLVLRKDGDNEQADMYKNLAKPYSKFWIIDK